MSTRTLTNTATITQDVSVAGEVLLNLALSGGDASINTGTGALTVSKIGGNAVTLGGALTISGAYATTLTVTNTTGVTLPTSGTLAILGANVFTALQTVTQGSANAGILASTGYSLTGSNATSMVSLAGTVNTSGNPNILSCAITNTAAGASTKYLNLLAGAAGATSVFSVDLSGNAIIASSLQINANGIQTSPSAATLQLGAADAGTAVAQSLRVQNVVAGTNNTAGANFTIKGSVGTGTGAGGQLIFQTAPASTTGTTQNTLATGLTITAPAVNMQPSAVIGNQALATTATDGFLYIASCAGTPTGVPTTFTGRVPMVVDSSNNTLSYYNGAWKPLAAAAVAMPGGRLTLATATPVMTATVSGATTVYYTPYVGRAVPIYNGSTFVTTDTGGELSQTTADTTKSPAAVAASSLYDIFVWNDAGTIRATRGPAWTNPTTRSAGTALNLLNGILVNNAAITNGPGQYLGTYVGTIASNASSTIDWILGTAASGGGAAYLMVWNYYNRLQFCTRVTDSGVAYSYTTATVRQARGSTTNQINYIAGVADDCITAAYQQDATLVAAVAAKVSTGVGDDSITVYETVPAQLYSNVAVATTGELDSLYHKGIGEPMLGQHYVAALEKGDGTNANTFNVSQLGELSFSFMM